MLTNEVLWEKISNYPIEELLPNNGFSKKMRSKYGWSSTKITSAISEYKRFIYLCVISNSKLSPSQIVDDVWHEHLLFTRDYWKNFTPLLEKEVHHHPGAQSKSEKKQLEDSYRKTYELYIKEFDMIPPKRIWVNPFHNEDRKQNTKLGILKRTKLFLPMSSIAFLSALLSFSSTQAVSKSNVSSDDQYIPDFIHSIRAYLFDNLIATAAIIIFLIILILVLFLEPIDNKSNCNSSCGSSCGGD